MDIGYKREKARLRAKKYRNNHPERNRESCKQWRIKNKKYCNIYYQEYRKNYPKKVLAHRLVRQAILSGILTKKPCEKCKSKKRIHAHHYSYDKPLKVVWLCPLHHKEIHKK